MTADDVSFLLKAITYVTGHGNTGDTVLKSTQARLKDYLANCPDLNVPQVIEFLDACLKFGSASQVPATYIMPAFNPDDYGMPPVEPVPPPEGELPSPESELPPAEEPVVTPYEGSEPAPSEESPKEY